MQKAIKLALSLNVGGNVIDIDAFVRINKLVGHRIEHGNSLCSKQLSILVEASEKLERCVAAIELGSELMLRFSNAAPENDDPANAGWCKSVLTSATEFGQHFILHIDLLEDRPGFINRLLSQFSKT